MTTEEAKIWRSVVATKPADWFTEDSHPLLLAYCRASAMADTISAELVVLSKTAGVITGGVEGMAILAKLRKELLAQRNGEVDKLVTLARSMRLSQQARLKAETAATAHGRATGTAGKKPWED